MARGGYKPVIEICGGTEIGGGFLAGCMLQPQSPSTFSTPTMGEPPCLYVMLFTSAWAGGRYFNLYSPLCLFKIWVT